MLRSTRVRIEPGLGTLASMDWVHLSAPSAIEATDRDGKCPRRSVPRLSRRLAEQSAESGLEGKHSRWLSDSQRELTVRFLEGRNTFGVLPTGSGKSLCFQLAAEQLRGQGLTLVVSPLIALMADQNKSRTAGVTFLNSTVTYEELRERRKGLWNGSYHLLYVTPEQLGSESLLRILTEGRRKVNRVAIDEAHCVSEWGHSFRVEYLLLRDALARLGRPPVLLLTATAPPEVRKDVVKQLGIELVPRRGGDLIIDHYRREELEPGVTRVKGRHRKYENLRKFIKEQGKQTRGIVYTRFATAGWEDGRENCQEIADFLESHRLGPVAIYHGQLPTDAKGVEQERFTEGDARIIVATNAFGLGIDLPKIDWIVHFYMPPSLLDYYQEIGRGGRGMESADGDRCECLILYDPDDRELVEGLVQGNIAGADKIARRFSQLIEGKGGQHGLRGPHEVLYDDVQKVLLLPFRPMKTQYTVRIAHLLALQDIGVVERLPTNLFHGDNVYAQFRVKREELTSTDQKKLEERQENRRQTVRERLDAMQHFCAAFDNDARWELLDREFSA
jgi:RecQ family ATP-dependent DNA helicase